MNIHNYEDLLLKISKINQMKYLVVASSLKKQLLIDLDDMVHVKIISYKEYLRLYDNEISPELLNVLYRESNNYYEAKIIMDVLKKYHKINLENKKIKKLNKIYQDNLHLIKSSKNKKIPVITSYSYNNEEELLLENSKKEVLINAYKTEEEEITDVAIKIKKLLNEGVVPSAIDLYFPEVLKPKVLSIFYMFKINIVNSYKIALITDKNVAKFIKSYQLDDLNDASKECKNEVIKIINMYGLENKEIVIKEIKQKMYINSMYENCINIVELEEINIFNHVFLMGMQVDKFLKVDLNNQYLSDDILQHLELETSIIKNKNRKYLLKYLINNTQYLNLSYTSVINNKPCMYERVLNEFPIKIEDKLCYLVKERYNDTYDKYVLKEQLEIYKIYKKVNYQIKYLYNNLSLPENYDNQYIKSKEYHYNEVMKLSSSSIQEFYECSYKFYLSKVLKIKQFKTNNTLVIGLYIHLILEKYYTPDSQKSIKKVIHENKQEYFNNYEGCISKKNFYFNKTNKFIEQLVLVLDEQFDKMSFEIIDVEDNYMNEYSYDLKDNFYLVGKIDLVLQSKDDFVVIDYKTGQAKLDFKDINLGLDLQNLIYFILLEKKHPKVNFAGTYRQKIAPLYSYKHEDTNLKKIVELSGITNNYMIDKINVDNLSGVKYKKDGTLTKNSTTKIWNQVDFEENKALVLQKIEGVKNATLNGDFLINPKINQKGDNLSCKYCSYEIICNKKKRNFERV